MTSDPSRLLHHDQRDSGRSLPAELGLVLNSRMSSYSSQEAGRLRADAGDPGHGRRQVQARRCTLR